MAESKNNQTYILDQAKAHIVDAMVECVQSVFGQDFSESKNEFASKMIRPKPEHGELAFPCFLLSKKVKGAPPKTASDLEPALRAKFTDDAIVEKVSAAGPYLNFRLTPTFIGSILNAIVNDSFLAKRSSEGKMRVMIEYSQPNTHKAFHVGHMRNCALGDSLVRLNEYMGHPVVAANYFGDEGAHVAKCLWYMQRFIKKNNIDLDSIPEKSRGEWLGGMYSTAVEMLALDSLTSLPYPGVRAAKVVSIGDHPAADAPKNWHVVQVTLDGESNLTVVCGGEGYKVDDLVAYLPVGETFNGKAIEPKDMKGVESHGIMLAERELGIESKKEEKKENKEEAKQVDNKDKKEKAPAPAKKDKKAAAPANNKIYVLPETIKVGELLVEAGRKAEVPAGQAVMQEYKQRSDEVKQTLIDMEHGEARICKLWKDTGKWSIDEFKRIYAWLNVRFDHDFFESDVGQESIELVKQYHAKGVFVNSNGAIGCDLTKHKLGFCLLLKSNGSGLYATKDLSLAVRKFDQFNIDKSIYVVDAAQTLHFQQVFKTLEVMGYEKAKNCFHLPYGQVVLSSGKMSSRTGTVIYFSTLREMLDKQVYEDFLKKYEGEWASEEIAAAVQRIAVATIKYGMLNHDTSKDIVFELSQWAAKSGNTGPYLLYAYARIKSILREVKPAAEAKVDYTTLTLESERHVLGKIHEWWPLVESVAARSNPSPLCDYLFDLAKAFSSWYESAPSLKKEENVDVQATRLQFVEAISLVIKQGLFLLGIDTLERM